MLAIIVPIIKTIKITVIIRQIIIFRGVLGCDIVW